MTDSVLPSQALGEALCAAKEANFTFIRHEKMLTSSQETLGMYLLYLILDFSP
jgi:hypothetical protein